MNDQNKNNQELNKSAQNVHSFGVQNDDLQAKEEIGNRINESKKKNLDNNTKRTSKDTASEMDSSSGSSLPKKDGLESSESTSLKDKLNPKNMLKNAGRNALEKKSEEDSLTGNAAKLGKSALDFKGKVDGIQKVIAFLSTAKGRIITITIGGLIALIIILMLGVIVSNPLQLIISSISMKYGLTGTDAYEVSTREGEEYEYMYENAERTYLEEFDRTQVDEMVDGSINNESKREDLICANQSIFRKIWLWIFKDYDYTDACEFMQYFRKQLKYWEGRVGDDVAPGYVMTTFYYAFETQNFDENGELFIPYTADVVDGEEEAEEPSSDIDAINLLFAHKKANGEDLFWRDDIDLLLEQYIYQEHYKYVLYEKVQDNPEKWECTKPKTSSYTYKVDVDKYKLFLRYGSYVSVGTDIARYPYRYKNILHPQHYLLNKYDILDELELMSKSGNRGYEGDKNIIAAYNATSPECYEELEKIYGTKPPSLSVYEIKAFPDKEEDDGAIVNISSGAYDYSKGYIFNHYPRYLPEFTITNEVSFNYVVAKEIEEFIEHISDRQDYGNYLLGYDSDIGNLIGTKGTGTTSTEIVCDYSELEDGSLVSEDGNIWVEWMYPDKLKFDAFDYTPNTSMGKIVDLETYVLGSIMLEAGGSLEWIEGYYATDARETVKARAIMIRSFLLANANASSNGTVQIANSTSRQLTCDPDEGCYRCADSNAGGKNGNGNYIAVPIDSEFAQNNSQCKKIEALPPESELRSLVQEVVGQVLTDSNGKVVSTNYNDTTMAQWYKDSNTDSSLADMDYIELLAYQYGTNYNLTTVECEVVTTGSSSIYPTTGTWDSWRQCSGEPWADQPFGTSATICSAGCLITSYAKLLAASGKDLLISPFNPGNYAIALNEADCFEGNNLKNYCALEVAVGAGNFTYSSGSLTGTQEEKRAFITNAINQGYQVIISVKNDGHWVYVTGTTSTDIIMSDPAGSSTNVFEKYGNTATSYKLIKIY